MLQIRIFVLLIILKHFVAVPCTHFPSSIMIPNTKLTLLVLATAVLKNFYLWSLDSLCAMYDKILEGERTGAMLITQNDVEVFVCKIILQKSEEMNDN